MKYLICFALLFGSSCSKVTENKNSNEPVESSKNYVLADSIKFLGSTLDMQGVYKVIQTNIAAEEAIPTNYYQMDLKLQPGVFFQRLSILVAEGESPLKILESNSVETVNTQKDFYVSRLDYLANAPIFGSGKDTYWAIRKRSYGNSGSNGQTYRDEILQTSDTEIFKPKNYDSKKFVCRIEFGKEVRRFDRGEFSRRTGSSHPATRMIESKQGEVICKRYELRTSGEFVLVETVNRGPGLEKFEVIWGNGFFSDESLYRLTSSLVVYEQNSIRLEDGSLLKSSSTELVDYNKPLTPSF